MYSFLEFVLKFWVIFAALAGLVSSSILLFYQVKLHNKKFIDVFKSIRGLSIRGNNQYTKLSDKLEEQSKILHELKGYFEGVMDKR